MIKLSSSHDKRKYNYRKSKINNSTEYDKDITISELLNEWYEYKKIYNKKSTSSKYDFIIKRHIVPDIGNYRIQDINTAVLTKYMKNKLNNGRIDKKGGLSAAYVRSIMIIISSAFEYAAKEGLCKYLISNIAKPPVESQELDILSEKEQEYFESYLYNSLNETNIGILLTLNTGMRIGEICALRWEDVDFENKLIIVKHTVSRVKNEQGGSDLIIDTAKTKASRRIIPIHSKLFTSLFEMYKSSVSEYVVSDKTSFISPRTYEYRYHKVLSECNMRHINFHALRHTFATRCILAGVDTKSLSEILGHSNVSITLNTYVHSNIEIKLKQIEKIII